MPRLPFSAKKSSPTIDVLYVVDADGNQVVTAAGDEVVIDAPTQPLTQRGDGLITDKPSHSQQKAPLTS